MPLSNTFETYNAQGNREDLSDIIYNIDPTECPFMMMAGRGKAKAKYHEWQLDSLTDAADDNAVNEGGDTTAGGFPALTATERVGNYTQISDKLILVSGTQEVVDKAGRKSELAYQISKAGKELKRDLEKQMCANKGSVSGPSGTARVSGSLQAWIETNVNYGAAGAAGGFGATTATIVDPATNWRAADGGTPRAFLESDLKAVIADCWDNGGDPTTILVGKFNKRVASGFTGNSTRFDRGEDKKLFAGIDYYVSDFGEHKIVPSRFTEEATAYVLTPKLWSVDYLRPFFQHSLAKTGDAEKRQLLVEYCLRSSNETGSGLVGELSES